MLRFYYNVSPNPLKVALLLEELGLAYEPIPVDVRKGEQFAPAFAALNPNHKVPCLVDDDAVVFDSNAILLYLAERSQRFLPQDTRKERGRLLSWLMFVASGVGPFSGQAVHFRHFAPEPRAYALNRYAFEAKRHYAVLDGQLATQRYLLGDAYTIVDMAVWGWAQMIPFVMGDDAAWSDLPNLKRLFDEVDARPAAARVRELKTRHVFKAGLDEETRRHMLKHTLSCTR